MLDAKNESFVSPEDLEARMTGFVSYNLRSSGGFAVLNTPEVLAQIDACDLRESVALALLGIKQAPFVSPEGFHATSLRQKPLERIFTHWCVQNDPRKRVA